MNGSGGKCLRALAVLSVAAFPALSVADPVPIDPMKAIDFTSLGSSTPASTQLAVAYDYNGMFTGTVTSQAFQLTDGDYAGQYVYLYQADNAGPSALEVVAISPFWSISLDGGGDEEAGYLTAGEPNGFLTDGDAPAGMSYDSAIPNPVVSANFPSYLGQHVPAGNHTEVLYLVSPHAPTMAEVYVIDGGTAVADAIGPVPEPSAAAILFLGSVLTVLRKRRIISP